jgi:hypothetical protein
MGTPLPPPPSSSSVLSSSFSGFPVHDSQFSAQKEAPPPVLVAPPPTPVLDQFGLLCVELLLPNVPPHYEAPELKTLIHTWLGQLQERASRFHGVVESTHQAIAFVVFKQEATVTDSVELSMQLVLSLMEFPLIAPSVPHSALRFGLAIEQTHHRNPIAGATERTLANVNQIVMGQPAAQLVSTRRYPLAPLKSDSPLLRQGNYYGFFWDEYQQFCHKAGKVAFEAEMTPLAPRTTNHDDGFGEYSYTAPAVLSAPVTANHPALERQQTPPLAQQSFQVAASNSKATVMETPPPRAVAYTQPSENTFHLFEEAPPFPKRTVVFVPFVATEAVEPANTSYRQVSQHLTQGLFAQLTHQPQAPALVVFKGATGIGKSALLQMVHAQLEQQFQPNVSPEQEEEPAFLWLYAGQPHTPALPLETWLDVLRGLFHIPTEGMPADYASQQIDQLINYIAPSDQTVKANEVARVIKALFGIGLLPEAPLPTSTVADSLFWVFQQLVAHKPVALILEDAEAIDETSGQVLFELLQKGLLQLPQLAVVLSTTPTYQPVPWLQSFLAQTSTLQLTLGTLSQEEAQEFLEAGPFSGQFNQFPVAFIQQLMDRAGSTPFHLDEAVRYMVLAGQLAQHPETGALSPTQWLQVPEFADNLPALFQKRYEALPAEQQQALDVASTLGPRFTMALFQAMLQQSEDVFNQTLQVLWEQGWIQPDVANLISFRHTAMQQYLRQRLGDQTRQHLHQQIYQTLKTGFPVATATCDGLLAYHAYQAGLKAEALHCIEAWGNRLGLLGCQQGQIQALWMQTNWMNPQTSQNHADILPYCQALEALAYPLQLQDPPFFADAVAYLAYQGIQQGVFALEIAKRYEWLGLLADVMEQRFELRKALVFRRLAMACLPAQDYPHEKAILAILCLELLQKMGDWEAVCTIIDAHLEPWLATLMASGGGIPNALQSWIGQYHRLLMVYKTHCLQWQGVEQVYQRLHALLQHGETPLSAVELALVQLARGRAWLWQGALMRAKSVLPETEKVLFSLASTASEGVSPLLLEAQVEWLLLQAEQALLGGGLLKAKLPQVIKAKLPQVIKAKLPHLQALAVGLPQAQLWIRLFESFQEPQQWWGLLNELLQQQLLGIRQRFLWVGLQLEILSPLGVEACLALVNRELPVPESTQSASLPVTLPAWQFTVAKGELLMAQGHLMEAGYWLQRYWKPVMQCQCFPFIVGVTYLVGRLNRLLALATTSVPQRQHYGRQSQQLLHQARSMATKMQSLSLVERIEAELQQ